MARTRASLLPAACALGAAGAVTWLLLGAPTSGTATDLAPRLGGAGGEAAEAAAGRDERTVLEPARRRAPLAAPAAAASDLAEWDDAVEEVRRRRLETVRGIVELKQLADQVGNRPQREAAWAALEAAMRSSDPVRAAEALRSVFELKVEPKDLDPFRAAILARLGDDHPDVVSAAAAALLRLEPAEGDLDRVLTEFRRNLGDRRTLAQLAVRLHHGRADGAVGEAITKMLGDSGRDDATGIAHVLRGMWVSPEVDAAVLAAWRRHDRPGGLWTYSLAQMRPLREDRARAVFALLADMNGELAGNVLHSIAGRDVDEATRPLAARLAAEALPRASAHGTDALFKLLNDIGTAEQAAAVRAFAVNATADGEIHRHATALAERLERRP